MKHKLVLVLAAAAAAASSIQIRTSRAAIPAGWTVIVPSASTDGDPIRLIIRMDDPGFCHATNLAMKQILDEKLGLAQGQPEIVVDDSLFSQNNRILT